MTRIAKTLLSDPFRRPWMPLLAMSCLVAGGCSLQPDSGGLGFDDGPPGIERPGDDGTDADGADDTSDQDAGTDDTSGAADGASDDGESSTDGVDETGGGGGGTSSGTDTGGSNDTEAGGTTDSDTGTAGGTGDQPGSGMYAHCLSVNDCEPGFGCLTNDTATDGFCSILCEPVGDPAGCAPDPAGVLDPVCTVAGGGESVCALDCSGGQPCPGGMICTADSLICM